MKTSESHMLNVAEVCDQFLIPTPLWVEPDVVNGDVDRVDEGDGNCGGVETGQVQPQHQITTGVDLYCANLK